MIRAIAAIDDERGIAASQYPPYGIPWDIPDDRQYFKHKTAGSTVIMGRQTYDTLLEPLPHRRNIVISRTLSSVRDGFEIIRDVAIYLQQPQEEDVWIIGGAELYATTLRYCQELFLTHVTGSYNCARFFPAYQQQFVLQSMTEHAVQNDYTYRFAVYTKKPVNPSGSPATSVCEC